MRHLLVRMSRVMPRSPRHPSGRLRPRHDADRVDSCPPADERPGPADRATAIHSPGACRPALVAEHQLRWEGLTATPTPCPNTLDPGRRMTGCAHRDCPSASLSRWESRIQPGLNAGHRHFRARPRHDQNQRRPQRRGHVDRHRHAAPGPGQPTRIDVPPPAELVPDLQHGVDLGPREPSPALYGPPSRQASCTTWTTTATWTRALAGM
jgi:hypothetical protein